MPRYTRIRLARQDDLPDVSRIIRRTLAETNAVDYSATVIENLQNAYSTVAIRRLARRRDIWLAEDVGAGGNEKHQGGGICGTVSLEDDTVQALFVVVGRQKTGLGRALMDHVEDVARARGAQILRLSASLTALGFYLRLGYQECGRGGDQFYGPVIRMKKQL